jgi:hypothetical protein
MRLRERLDRIEKRVIPADPLQELTDEELEAAMASLRVRIEAEFGMSESELAEKLKADLANGSLASDLDEDAVRAFVNQVKRERRANA